MNKVNRIGRLAILRLGARKLRLFSKDQKGATAVELGLVAVPFFVLSFGVMLVGMKYFTENAVEHAVEKAAREIRTGQAQQAGKTLSDFRDMVCAEAASYIKCDSKLVIHVQSGDEWSDITPTPCLSGGALTPSSGEGTDPLAASSGGADAVVLVTVCYEWDMPQTIQFAGLGQAMSDMSNGSSLVQAVSTFKTEPYN